MPRKSIYDAKYRRLLARLREARKLAGLDQVEVSRKLKYAENFCNRIESGERRLQVVDLASLARLYDLPLRFFLPDTPAEDGKK